MKRKINIKGVVVGIIVLLGFSFSITISFEEGYLRNHGKVIKTKITKIDTRNFMAWAYVNINHKEINAGRIQYENGPKVGDIIEIYYIPSESNAVQTDFNRVSYSIIIILESLLFISGIYLTIGGFIGKKIPEVKPFSKTSKSQRKKTYLNM